MKKVLIGAVAVFIAMFVMGYIVEYLILGSTFESLKHLWRPDYQSLMWIYYVMMLVGSFFFSFIFSKGYEKKGILEGVRYGLYIGIWMSIGMAYGTYAMIDIPHSLAIQWFIYGIIEYVIYGVLLSLVFKKVK